MDWELELEMAELEEDLDYYDETHEWCQIHKCWFEIDEGCIDCEYDYRGYNDPY